MTSGQKARFSRQKKRREYILYVPVNGINDSESTGICVCRLRKPIQHLFFCIISPNRDLSKKDDGVSSYEGMSVT